MNERWFPAAYKAMTSCGRDTLGRDLTKLYNEGWLNRVTVGSRHGKSKWYYVYKLSAKSYISICKEILS